MSLRSRHRGDGLTIGGGGWSWNWNTAYKTHAQTNYHGALSVTLVGKKISSRKTWGDLMVETNTLF